jgi:hypothetical protein
VLPAQSHCCIRDLLRYSTALRSSLQSPRNLACTHGPYTLLLLLLLQGAAQATLAAFMLTLDGFTNVFLFTFGSPQIGDAAWRAAFDAALGINQLMAVDWWNMEVSEALQLHFVLFRFKHGLTQHSVQL